MQVSKVCARARTSEMLCSNSSAHMTTKTNQKCEIYAFSIITAFKALRPMGLASVWLDILVIMS